MRRAHSSRLGSFASIPLRPLAELRVRLTLWYVLTFSAILLLLGAGLFVVIRRQISQQLSHSLESATTELVRAVRIRERENGTVVYSFDIRVKGQPGYEEVNVSAIDGSVVSKQHETAAQEKAERKAEKKGEKAEMKIEKQEAKPKKP